MEYHHTQIGIVIIVAMGIVILFLVPVSYFTSGFIDAIGTSLIVVVLLVLSLFVSLTVDIKDRSVICYFGPGLIRKSIALSDIRAADAVRNPWVVGWGIHWVPGHYWLWNVSGRDAVELTLANGKKFRIGTDEPDALIRAIHVNKSAVT